MKRPKSHPLLTALIDTLPLSDGKWPVERQMAWLNLMAMAFGVVYGGDAAARLAGRTEAPSVPNGNELSIQMLQPEPATPVTHKFIIDAEGYVRRGTGNRQRLLPADVTGEIVDLRGDGDLRTIIWADDSTGLNGQNLTISAA